MLCKQEIFNVAMQLVENAFVVERFRMVYAALYKDGFTILTDDLGPALTLLGVPDGDGYDREPFYEALRDPRQGPLSFVEFVEDNKPIPARED